MGQINVVAEREFAAPPGQVLELVADYAETRAQLWPENITGYRVLAGGKGAGTRIGYRLHATKKRIRDVTAEVTAPDESTLVEADQNSTLRTVWRVLPQGDGSHVTVTTTWTGAGGVGGFFERIFAPIGVRKLWNAVLDNLGTRL
ncbi:SRPBCC family protein [Frankia sp. CNm7]|uniref:SRPBCC family protein n=1 Tax=Frankia nepalensis TaxID=1836974 RepID=A0A937RU28_9ACTN|nr:SRPBCC family protein [Frankia nepalensis]MBL7497279.1 SRPBCC family protein [Frankia nepalensis]MBL7512146.1 SRPBCC family protein [Frankia nepalensis]MBL7520371.1 SRPBCC family protein [Frankia nepalensis]MBL7631916.1 SRPBCC family protein [Frankia nepalensis]